MFRSSIFSFGLLLTSQTSFAQPVHHWPLDGTQGTTMAIDIIGGAHGSLQNGATHAPTSGHHDGCIQCDGMDDRIDVGAVDLTTGNGLTLSFWVKPTGASTSESILMSKGTGSSTQDHIWSVSIVNGSGLRFRLKALGSTTELNAPGSTVLPGSFQHIAASYDGAQMLLYVNGSLAAFANKTGAIGYHPSAPASFCDRTADPGSAPFNGLIDDVRIYDHALSQSEIFDIVLEDLTTNVATTDLVVSGLRSLFMCDLLGRPVSATRHAGAVHAGYYLKHGPSGVHQVLVLP